MGFYTHFQENNVGFFHRLKNNFILCDNLLFVSLWLLHYNTASVRDKRCTLYVFWPFYSRKLQIMRDKWLNSDPYNPVFVYSNKADYSGWVGSYHHTIASGQSLSITKDSLDPSVLGNLNRHSCFTKTKAILIQFKPQSSKDLLGTSAVNFRFW